MMYLVCLPPEDGGKIDTETCREWMIEDINLF
jgi:hypothetical protein